MKSRKAVALCAAVGVAVAGLALATPAYADPVANSYSLVGSDTLQDAANALVNGTSISGSTVRVTTATGTTLGSFDAFGSAAIQVKSAGKYFARPAGSGDGVKALSRSIDGNPFSVSGNATPATVITGQVDIARSSSGPAVIDANGALEYFQFGRDAVSYAYNGTGLEQITGAQLKQIYECTLTTINGVAVKPTIPQVGSGTAKFFLGAIGVTTLGSCVTQNVQENDGTVLTQVGQIVPFSVASWVAQSNNAAQNRLGTVAKLGSTQGATAPFTGTGAALVPNSAFYSSATWGRDTYVVVEAARVLSGPKFDANLAALVNPSLAKSLTNFGSGVATSGAVKIKFGFLPPSTTTPIRAAIS